MKIKGLVYDKWWPHRTGRVVKRTASRVWVRWVDGEVWKYDLAHANFLAPMKARK